MRILFSGPRFHANYNGMIGGLLNRGHEVGFISLYDDFRYCHYSQIEKFSYRKKINWTHHLIKYFGRLKVLPPGLRYIVSISEVRSHFNCFKPDVIILRDFTWANLVLLLIAKKNNIPVVLYNLNEYNIVGSCYKNWFLRYLDNHYFQKLRITPVRFGNEKDYLEGQGVYFFDFPVYQPFAYRNGVAKAGPKLKVCTIGKLDQERKRNIDLVAQCYDLLISGRIELTIIGAVRDLNNEVYISLKRQIKGLPNINLVENIPNDKCRNILAEQDLFLFPAVEEPLGYAILEAMASGLPVICSDTCGIGSVIVDYYNGFILRGKELSLLVPRIIEVIDNPKLLNELKQNVLKTIDERHLPDQFAGWFEKLYFEMIKIN